MAYLDKTGLSRVWSKVKDAVISHDVLVINCGNISTLPTTISNAAITENHVAIKAEAGSPNAVRSDWTVITSSGSFTIQGTIKGTTSLVLYFALKQE